MEIGRVGLIRAVVPFPHGASGGADVSGDGRLDLDELGEVIDHASVLEPAAVADARGELLDDGFGLSWAQRLDDAGVTPWLRRHRVAVGSVAAVVVAGSAVVVLPAPRAAARRPGAARDCDRRAPSQYVIGDSYQAFDQPGDLPRPARRCAPPTRSPARPPPTTPRPTASSASSARRCARAARRRRRRRTQRARAVARRTSTPSPTASTPGFLGSRASDYTLVVSRTDDRGRTTTRPVPMPNGAPDWSAFVTATCLQTQAQFGLVPRAVSVSVDRRAHVLSTGIVVSNAMAVPTTVTMSPSYGITQVVPTMPPTQLPALRGAVLPIDLEVRDCANPTLPFIGLPSFPAAESYDGGAPGFYLAVAFPPDVVDQTLDPTGARGTGLAPVTFPASQQRVLDDALRSLCAGAPPAAAEVREVGFARRVLGVFPSGNAQSTRFPITLAVTVPGAERVRITSPQPPPEESLTARVAPVATTSVVDGRATLRTWVDVDCQTGYVPPPLCSARGHDLPGCLPASGPGRRREPHRVDRGQLPRAAAPAAARLGWAAPA